MGVPPICAWWHHRVVLGLLKVALLANIKAALMCLITFTNSSLWTVRMSVLHDFCRACSRHTEGRSWSVHLKCPNCSYVLNLKPQRLPRDLLRLREPTPVTQRQCGGVTNLLSHQLLSCSLFLISQEAPRGCCLDCHCSAPLSFNTILMFTCFLCHLCQYSSL